MSINAKKAISGDITAKAEVVGEISVGKPLAKLRVETIDGGHRITITDPDGVQTLDIMDGKDGVITKTVISELLGYSPLKGVKLNGSMLKAGDDNVVDLGTLAVLVDGLIKASDLPLVSSQTRGVISPQDKSKLDNMVSAALYFEEVGTDTVDCDTSSQDRYNSFTRVSDAAPTYEELSLGTSVYREYITAGNSSYSTVTPRIYHNEASGYCSLSNGGAEHGIVVYENNTLGIMPGTYLHEQVVSMTVKGFTGYKKTVLKADCIPAGIGGVSEEEVQQAVTDALALMQIISGIKANGGFVEADEEGNVDLGKMVQSTGISGDPGSAQLGLQAGSESYKVPVIKSNGKIGAALLPLASENGPGAITADLYNKLSGIEDGAEKNIVTAVTYRNRGGSGAIGYVITDADGAEFMVPRMGWETSDGVECIYYGVLPEADRNRKGAMSAEHYQKLEGIAEGATKVTVPADIGAEVSGTAATVIGEHNTNVDAHNDIRLLIEGLTTRLNMLANSDDVTLDQMIEVVAYIKTNRTLIESVTTNKVNVADIINNLTTNVADKPLAAAQGVVMKGMIDNLQVLINAIKVPTKVSELNNDSKYVTEDELTAKKFAKESDVTKLSEEIADLKALLVDGNEVEY